MLESILSILPDSINNVLAGYDDNMKIVVLMFMMLFFIVLLALYIFVCIILFRIKKKVFTRIEKEKGNSITVQFMDKAVSVLLIVVLIVFPLGRKKLAQSLLGSSAVIAVIVGLAANEVLKDMFAGLEISIYKPFDVGSRIMLADGRCGIVEKMTLRHVVIMLLDTTRLIIPNSVANSMVIVNYSYEDTVPRSMEVRFPISYDSDVDRAKDIIRETICYCPLTLNEDKYDEEVPNSKSVYFLKLDDSSLILGATVYYPHNIRTEVVTDEINSAVFKALKHGGIEIPYNYLNVVVKE